MSHVSTNFDRTGFQQDHNVVFPIDRLNELAEEGEVGSVASIHYSFMGATHPAKLERAAHQLARVAEAGLRGCSAARACLTRLHARRERARPLSRKCRLATASVGLIRVHTEKFARQRALWVPFELGRPLGVPGRSRPSRRACCERCWHCSREPQGPVLSRLSGGGDPVPASDDLNGMACPLRFRRAELQARRRSRRRCCARSAELQPWYDLAHERRRRTTFGVADWSYGVRPKGLTPLTQKRQRPRPPAPRGSRARRRTGPRMPR